MAPPASLSPSWYLYHNGSHCPHRPPTGHSSTLRPNPPELLNLHLADGSLVEAVNDRGAVPHDVTEFLGVVVFGVVKRTERVA